MYVFREVCYDLTLLVSSVSSVDHLRQNLLTAGAESLHELLCHADFPPALVSDIETSLTRCKWEEVGVLLDAAKRAVAARGG